GDGRRLGVAGRAGDAAREALRAGPGRRSREGPDLSSVLILSGPPGAGKTTVASLLTADAERAVHVEADTFFRFVRGGYIDPSTPPSHEQNGVVMRAVADAAAAYAHGGY